MKIYLCQKTILASNLNYQQAIEALEAAEKSPLNETNFFSLNLNRENDTWSLESLNYENNRIFFSDRTSCIIDIE